MPRRYFRKYVLWMIPAALLPMLYSYALYLLFSSNILSVDFMLNRVWMLLLLTGGQLVALIWVFWGCFLASRYMKRFAAVNGKRCFVCDYDLIEGQKQCPECGSLWEPEKLGRRWKKHLH